MPDAITAAESSMLGSLARLQAISQNLSNINTAGYKAQHVVTRNFGDLLDARQQTHSVATKHAAGSFDNTGRTLDFALGDAATYFRVQTDQGVLFTRRGDFRLDGSGRLVTVRGLPVLGEGGEIRLENEGVNVDESGIVRRGDQRLGRLDLMRFERADQLAYVGGGLFRAAGQGTAVPAGEARVLQGHLETSNVDPMHEMVSLIELVRHFELSQEAFKGRDEMLESAINSLGASGR